MLKTSLAIGSGQLTAAALSGFRLGAGTSLPGKIARRIDPGILRILGAQLAGEVVAVTGTNGKTTTCAWIARFLEACGQRVAHNALGANMLPGVTAALVFASGLDGRLKADAAVLEVDEASFPAVAKEIEVGRVVVTNLFRDQLDRYGELDTTAAMIRSGLMAGSGRALLNADDPLVAALCPERDGLFFGIEQVLYGPDATEKTTEAFPVGFPREVSQCPACGATLDYTRTLYGHLGHYVCRRGCGFSRPMPSVVAETVRVDPHRSELALRCGDLRFSLTLEQPGLFNVYNLLAAVTVVYDRFPEQTEAAVREGLTRYRSVFGRAERKMAQGKNVMVLLVKNPVGASEVLRLVAGDPSARLLVALNDDYADGRDVSWIWDAEFETLAMREPAMAQPIFVSGDRAEDMALRLKYAGLPSDALVMERSLKSAVSQALEATQPDETLYILPTYTALLSLRSLLP